MRPLNAKVRNGVLPVTLLVLIDFYFAGGGVMQSLGPW